jgi:hypothetical protein
MANRESKLHVRISTIDEQYLQAHVKLTGATPSDIVRALIRHTDPEQCKQYLRLEGKAL